jgi:hypothetical protein
MIAIQHSVVHSRLESLVDPLGNHCFLLHLTGKIAA